MIINYKVKSFSKQQYSLDQLIIHTPCTINIQHFPMWAYRLSHMASWAALCEKVPNGLSRCHTKRRMGARGRTHPSFGRTHPSFGINSLCNRLTKRRAGAATRARPSFGMTMTQDFRDLFAWRSPVSRRVWVKKFIISLGMSVIIMEVTC